MTLELKAEIKKKAAAAGQLDKKAGYVCRPWLSDRYNALIEYYPAHKDFINRSYIEGYDGVRPNLNTRVPFSDEC